MRYNSDAFKTYVWLTGIFDQAEKRYKKEKKRGHSQVTVEAKRFLFYLLIKHMFNICGAGYSDVPAVTFREHRKSCTAVIFKIFCGLFASSIGPVLNQSILNFGNTRYYYQYFSRYYYQYFCSCADKYDVISSRASNRLK